MRTRSEKWVTAFATTAAALAMEAACKEAGLPGRLIPTPRSISAGCGLCWAGPLESREALEALIVEKRLEVTGIYHVLL